MPQACNWEHSLEPVTTSNTRSQLSACTAPRTDSSCILTSTYTATVKCLHWLIPLALSVTLMVLSPGNFQKLHILAGVQIPTTWSKHLWPLEQHSSRKPMLENPGHSKRPRGRNEPFHSESTSIAVFNHHWSHTACKSENRHQRSAKWQIHLSKYRSSTQPLASARNSAQLIETQKPGANLTTPVIKLKKVPNLTSTACISNLFSIKHAPQQYCHELKRETLAKLLSSVET